ncbi:Hsp20/alpha crystallin family protein [Pseudoramibacter alactolyticus ATCC 23263]|jgi:HSP20 family molecular chaperone IbpA|uniref:Hsp20/alpha crystallin family protein n=2 Tax=Pseudoramibacter TaxID=113286 RepID=E6MIW2_9FIRM|nr:Hsp20/alpha crystallin family protein [Pseudoramibacter alactolyticus ATCC 23263]
MTMLPTIFGENIFDNLMNTFDRDFFSHWDSSKLMRTDVKENDDSYELKVNLPGLKKEDVRIELNQDYLTISAKAQNANDEKDDSGKYVRRERYYGSYQRQFYLGEGVKQEDIHASMADGVLTLTIPKVDQQQVETAHRIEIEG